jgi:sulfoxide reductase heme-binding subunit YedZ
MPNGAIPYLKAMVHIVCLLPFAYLFDLYRTHRLAAYADPVNYITHFTGDWALWLLLLTLAVTPVRRLTPSLAPLIRFRRMLGLYAFFYATLHLLTYVLLFSGYDVRAAFDGLRQWHVMEPIWQLKIIWPKMIDDVEKRRFIQVGLAAWFLLLTLALTSTQASIRAMGGWVWQGVHRLIYVAAGLAVIHYWWLVKQGVRTPWKVTAVLVVLLLWRVGLSVAKRSRAKALEAAWSQKRTAG